MLTELPTFDRGRAVNIVIEASKGSRIKLKYDDQHGIFRAEKVLPLGLVFPFGFGFLPSTRGEDGDPLDVLLLSDAALPVQSLALGRIIHIMKCEQKEKGSTERNDRLLAIPLDAKSRKPMQPGVKFDAEMRRALSAFFVKYNKLQGKSFRVLAIEGSQAAQAVIERGMRAAAKNTAS
jgi:inorganic pyrophosphatase